MQKRGQELSTNAIILIILGVIVLVALAIGFYIGFDRIAPFLSGDNVQNVANQCSIACSTRATYDYCSKSLELKGDGVPTVLDESFQAKVGAGKPYANTKANEQSCYVYSYYTTYQKFAIPQCPELVSECIKTTDISFNDQGQITSAEAN